ncbi:hypothetical protein ACJJTC_016121 [Scirpophaga incertulas]
MRVVAVDSVTDRRDGNKLRYDTLRLRRNNSEHNALLEEMAEAPDAVDADARANMIVREMEQHQRLMEDSPASEELRREALRDLPQGLTMKRHVRAKLSASVSLRSKRRPISCIKSLKYRASFAFKRMRERSRDVIFSLELWYGSIRNIEGHFGSAVGSYFRFLRWLFLLDLLLCALLLSFVVVPWALRRNGDHAAGTPFSFMDLLSGQGSFEDSLLFFGHYRPGDVGGTLPYNMSYAYFFTMLCVYIIFLVLLCYKTAHSYRRNFIETSGGVSHSFASRVFCGWDFGIAELLSSQIKKKSTDSFWIRTWKKTTNVAVTALVAAALGAGGYGLWKLLETSLSPLLLSGLLALVLAVCPLLFGLVARMEYYSPRTGLYVTLARAWLLDLAALLLLMVYWARPGPGLRCVACIVTDCWSWPRCCCSWCTGRAPALGLRCVACYCDGLLELAALLLLMGTGRAPALGLRCVACIVTDCWSWPRCCCSWCTGRAPALGLRCVACIVTDCWSWPRCCCSWVLGAPRPWGSAGRAAAAHGYWARPGPGAQVRGLYCDGLLELAALLLLMVYWPRPGPGAQVRGLYCDGLLELAALLLLMVYWARPGPGAQVRGLYCDGLLELAALLLLMVYWARPGPGAQVRGLYCDGLLELAALLLLMVYWARPGPGAQVRGLLL